MRDRQAAALATILISLVSCRSMQTKVAVSSAPTPRRQSPCVCAATFLVFFDRNSSALSPLARRTIAQAAKPAYREQAAGRIRVDGYTDRSGSAAINLKLSLRRAEEVVDELVRDGVPREAIGLKDRGDADPLELKATSARVSENRRVEILYPDR